MATTDELEGKINQIANIEGDLRHAIRVCDTLKKMAQNDEPSNWSCISIHASSDIGEEILYADEHPAIGRGWMIEFLETYKIEPLREELAKAKTELREMVSEDYL